MWGHALILGQLSGLWSAVAYACMLSALVSAGWSGWSFVRTLLRSYRQAATESPIQTPAATFTSPTVQRRIERVSKSALLVLSGVLVGSYVGYSYRNAQLISNNYPLSNVLVLQKFDDFSFRLQTEQGQGFNATLCPDSRVDWQPGEKLKVWNYEQRKGCKRNMGFLAYTDDRGNRISYKGELANAGY